MERVHTHYDNLKVTRNAPFEVMKAAYRAMAQKYHPDLNPAADAARVMKIINEAWYVLSDPARRAEHDEWIAGQEAGQVPKTSASPNKHNSFTAGANSSDSKRESSDFESRKANSSFYQKKEEPAFSAYGTSAGATEGYKAATPDWLRSLNYALIYLSDKLGKSKAQVFGVTVLGTALMAIMGTLSFVSDRTANPSNSSVSTNRDSAYLSDAEVVGRADARVSGGANASALQNQDKVIADIKRPQPPTTFSFEEASAPVNADLNRIERSAGFKPFNGVLDAQNTDREPWKNYAPIESAEAETVRLPSGYLKGEKQIFTGGLSKFIIDNSNGSHVAEVRLYLSGKQVRAMFVRVGTTFTAEKLGPGTYKMRYKMNINGKISAFQAKEEFVLTQTVTPTESGTSTRFSNMTVTLYKVRDGNMQVEEIPLDKF